MARAVSGKPGRTVVLDGDSLTVEQVADIADGARSRLGSRARGHVRAARRAVENSTRDGRTVYGVNTGFGNLAKIRIDDADLDALQDNLIRSHSAGVGDPLPDRVVRAILALRINCLARGHSGIRVETLDRMVEMLDSGVLPVVPEKGSVGASGDLAPLAHVALALIGEGEVRYRGRRMKASTGLRRAGIDPVRLRAKEGLALINGTQVMTAIGALALLDAERLTRLADVIGAMSLEATLGSHRAFDARVHAARPQTGQVLCADNMRRLLGDSPIAESHADCDRVQDAYSMRCMPQVHGATRDGLAHVRRILAVEINASTDNPMVFAEDGDLVSAGNFHGQPVAAALDQLAIAVASLAAISERRIERLLNPDLSGLPAFLAHDPGLNSGFMIAHVTAAALVSENKVLAHPASVDSIPTSAAKEDHVSMGVHAARKGAEVVRNATDVVAIEALCAAQAIDMRRPTLPGRGVRAAHRVLRRHVSHMDADRVLADDITAIRMLFGTGEILGAVQRAVGRLC